jgi:hypothetical protein
VQRAYTHLFSTAAVTGAWPHPPADFASFAASAANNTMTTTNGGGVDDSQVGSVRVTGEIGCK